MLKPLLNVFHAALCVGLVSASIPCNAAELVLVEDGEALAPIVIFADAPPKTRRAADELADYIEKTTGARPDVLEGQPDPLPDRAIWVGVQPALNELFPELDFDFQHPEEILIAANEAHLVIAGRDRWNPEHLVVQGQYHPVTIRGMQMEYGTANAVYTFLRDWLDVRWLWPGELGEDLVERPTLAFEPFTYRYHPQFRQRSGVLYLSALDNRSGQSHAWARFQRIQLGSLSMSPSSHGFSGWWERFHESHPEYFAMQPDGTRDAISSVSRPSNVKICQSNPLVWEQWIADVEAALARNPNVTVFDAGPNDGWSSGHCVCENCLAWDHPDGEARRYNWRGLTQEYVALTDRDVTFYNHLGRRLKARFPGRDLYVRGSAYGNTLPAPIGVKPAENVIITGVHNFLLWRDAVARGARDFSTRTMREQFHDWGKLTPVMGWRPNITGWVRNGLPNLKLTEAMEDMRFVAEQGVVAIAALDTFPEFWATQGPLYYALAHLAWDPDQDPQALMADYTERGFGKAADRVAAYWALVEGAAHAMTPLYAGGSRDYAQVYDETFLRKTYAELDAAAELTVDEPARFAQRVAFVRAGLDYTRLYLELLSVMDRYRQSHDQDSEAADRARDIWSAFDRIGKEHPYALNWSLTWLRRMMERRLHPDFEG